MTVPMAPLDWVIVFAVLGGVIAVGLMTRRYMESVADFLSAGRSVGRLCPDDALGSHLERPGQDQREREAEERHEHQDREYDLGEAEGPGQQIEPLEQHGVVVLTLDEVGAERPREVTEHLARL